MIARLLAVVLLAALGAGCNIIQYIAAVATPPLKIPATYTPAREPMLILVENYASPATAYLEAQHLTDTLHRQLSQHGVAPQIDPARIDELRQADPSAFRAMSIAQVGRKLDARQVLYVRLVTTSRDTAARPGRVQSSLAARVKIVDTATGASRWPLDTADGFPLGVDTPYQLGDDSAPDANTRAQICTALAEQIAQLFYERPSE